MSIRAIVWAFDQECPTPAAKLVLIKLADHSNDDGECWPSQGRVAKDCGLTRETVNRQVKALAAAGLLEIHHQMNGSGQMANRYRLRCDNKSHPPVISDHSPSDDRSHPPVISDHTEPSLITVIEPSISSSSRALRTRDLNKEFSEVWMLYPRHVGKGAALKAYHRARKVAGADTLREGIERLARARAGEDQQFTPHMATWLNQQRWLDGEPDERNGHDRLAYRKPSGPPPPLTMAEWPAEEKIQGSRH